MSLNDDDFWRIVQPLQKKRRWWQFWKFVRFRRRPRTTGSASGWTRGRIIALGVILALVAGGYYVANQLSMPTARATPLPTGPPPSAKLFGPFEGTPAAKYSEGANGIVLPAASATGGWSADEVRNGLVRAKNALVASHLDHRMVVNRDPSAFLALLAEDSRLTAAQNLGSFAVRVAPQAKLAADQPRVAGRTSFSVVAKDGRQYLDVFTNYVWAYAFTGANSYAGEHLVVVHDEIHWAFYRAGGGISVSSQGLRLLGQRGYVVNVDCATLDRGLIAPPRSAVTAAPGADSGDDLYDPDRSLEIPDTCHVGASPKKS